MDDPPAWVAASSGPAIRVLVALHEEHVGGATRAILRLAPLLEQRGCELVFWAPRPSETEVAVRGAGFPVSGAPRLVRYSWDSLRQAPGARRRLVSVPEYLRRFGAYLDEQHPAIVHANTLLTLPEAAIARQRGYPTLVHAHEMLDADLRGAVTALLARCAHVVLAPSMATARALRRFGVTATVVHNGVDLPDRPRPARPANRGVVIGTVATVSRRKGSDLFLAAALRIRNEIPEAEFRMIGPSARGPEERWANEVIAAANQLGIETGTREDVSAELVDWDIFTLPSRQDPFPLAVLEAMAMGVPVVASRVGGLPEQVTAGSGILVDANDPYALADAVIGLARDPALRAAMGAAARVRAATEFSLEGQADRLREAYLRTIALAEARRRFAL